MDRDYFFDFCGDGGTDFFLVHFPLAVEGLGKVLCKPPEMIRAGAGRWLGVPIEV